MIFRIIATVFFILFLHSASAADLDVFLIAGQSNAAGGGDANQSPPVDTAHVLQYWNGALSPANDPVGNSFPLAGATSGGSAWPSFGKTYYMITGRSIMFVPGPPVGGTGQCASADMGTGFSDVGLGNWDSPIPSGGTLVVTALNTLQAALNAATMAGWTPHVVGTLWVQGENDGTAINNKTETTTDYKACMLRTINRIQGIITALGHPGSYFFIFRTGAEVNVNDTGFAAVRQAQEDVAAQYHDSLNVRMVFRGALAYAQTCCGIGPVPGMADGAHYNQPALNLMGSYGAMAVIARSGL